MSGALDGVRIMELAAMGPAPFCGMMLADHGADVIVVERPIRNRMGNAGMDILNRSRRSIVLDLKKQEAREVVRRLVKQSDGLIEGFRPGVMESLGLGPDLLLQDNPSLVYGRMTGWGQTGPAARSAGHDINYLALSGILDWLGRADEKPTPAVNMLADLGGGGMLLAFGMLAGIFSARSTGKGQVIDCAMLDGASLMGSMIWTMVAQGRWPGKRGENLLDTGAHFYETYETADGKFMAVGAIEAQFYQQFRDRMGLDDISEFDAQMERSQWPGLKARLTEIFRTRTREEWCAIFLDSDACVTPVLSADEIMSHPHNAERELLVEAAGVRQPAPAPRFSLSTTTPPRMPQERGRDTDELLRAAGYSIAEIADLRVAGVLGPTELMADVV